MEIALATCRVLPEPDPDAGPLLEALAAAGLPARFRAWDDPGEDWSRARLTLLRSTWNYPLDPEGFLRWAEGVARRMPLWNPIHVVRWNLHKRYLLELENQGVPIAPTRLVRRGAAARLGDLAAELGARDLVVKPAVSAASFRTMRVGPEDLDAGQAHLDALVRDRDALVQAYLPSVEDYGERALVWVDGALTHAVRKSPRFAGEDESVSPGAVPIRDAEARLAQAALEAAPGPLLYARVDVAPGPSGEPVVMELELMEPSLFFHASARALERMVAALRRLWNEAAGP